MNDPWNANTNKIIPWPVDNYQEINLREELSLIFYGGDQISAKAHPVLYRRLDRNQRCNCVEQGQARTDCPACKGEGFRFTEQIYYSMKRTIYGSGDMTADVGIVNIREVVYYFEYHVVPKKGDCIFEINAENKAIPTPPFVRERRYNVESAEEFRDIDGRIVFWQCWTEAQQLGETP